MPHAPDHKAHYGDPSTELMTFDFDFIQWLMGPPGRLSASAARSPEGAAGEITALLHYPDGRHATVTASGLMPPGFPFSVGFRALFERAAFDHRAVFESDGPPKSTFTIFSDKAQGAPYRCHRAIPTRSNCNASWIASTAAPIRRFWMSSGRSKP